MREVNEVLKKVTPQTISGVIAESVMFGYCISKNSINDFLKNRIFDALNNMIDKQTWNEKDNFDFIVMRISVPENITDICDTYPVIFYLPESFFETREISKGIYQYHYRTSIYREVFVKYFFTKQKYEMFKNMKFHDHGLTSVEENALETYYKPYKTEFHGKEVYGIVLDIVAIIKDMLIFNDILETNKLFCEQDSETDETLFTVGINDIQGESDDDLEFLAWKYTE